MMLDHKHAAHPGHDADHAPIGVPDSDHEQVFSRDVAKDQVRVSQGTLLGFAIFGLASWLVATLRLNRAALIGPRQRRETGPPCAHVWQFVRRCAPLSAAPPALR